MLQFGEKIVKELKQAGRTDTLSKWMAHYLCDLIMEAKNCDALLRHEKEKDCFETILKLWSHREDIPWRKPFQSFEQIIAFFEHLTSQENYVRSRRSEFSEEDEWLKASLAVSDAARHLIRWTVANASLQAKEKEHWLEVHIPQPFLDNENAYLSFLFISDSDYVLSNKKDSQKKKDLQLIQESLNSIMGVGQVIQDEINRQLQSLKDQEPSS